MRWLLLIFLFSCSTKNQTSIKSLPEGAKVLITDSSGVEQLIGMTPVKTENKMQSILLEKEGYEPVKIFLNGANSENLEFDIKLEKKEDDLKFSDFKKNQEKLARNIAKANSLIHLKRYPEASSILQNVVNDFPHVSVGYDLLGNISYLQRDFKQAEQYYQKSIQISPDNVETQNVLERIKKITQQESL